MIFFRTISALGLLDMESSISNHKNNDEHRMFQFQWENEEFSPKITHFIRINFWLKSAGQIYRTVHDK